MVTEPFRGRCRRGLGELCRVCPGLMGALCQVGLPGRVSRHGRVARHGRVGVLGRGLGGVAEQQLAGGDHGVTCGQGEGTGPLGGAQAHPGRCGHGGLEPGGDTLGIHVLALQAEDGSAAQGDVDAVVRQGEDDGEVRHRVQVAPETGDELTEQHGQRDRLLTQAGPESEGQVQRGFRREEEGTVWCQRRSPCPGGPLDDSVRGKEGGHGGTPHGPGADAQGRIAPRQSLIPVGPGPPLPGTRAGRSSRSALGQVRPRVPRPWGRPAVLPGARRSDPVGLEERGDGAVVEHGLDGAGQERGDR